MGGAAVRIPLSTLAAGCHRFQAFYLQAVGLENHLYHFRHGDLHLAVDFNLWFGQLYRRWSVARKDKNGVKHKAGYEASK